jgi:light-regulated signal transduction histidine kinase (bacteriophytochrome)
MTGDTSDYRLLTRAELIRRLCDLEQTNRDLHRERQALVETRAHQNEPVGRLTHDLNQALSTIVAYAQLSLSMLQDKTSSSADVADLLGEIVTQTARMRDINRSLQNLVKQL